MSTTFQEAEEILKRIGTHKGVVGTIVINPEDIPVHTSMDNSTTVQHTGPLVKLTKKARNVVRDLDPTDDLLILRIRSKKHEIICAPSDIRRSHQAHQSSNQASGLGYLLVTIQSNEVHMQL